jgi:hypothetical protein
VNHLFCFLFGRALGLLSETLGAGFWHHHHLFTWIGLGSLLGVGGLLDG